MTQDLDLLGQGENSPEALANTFRRIAATNVPTGRRHDLCD